MSADGNANASKDPARCPVCGGPNLCAMAAPSNDEPCWCTQIEPSLAALARIPPDERGARCMCPRCATAS